MVSRGLSPIGAERGRRFFKFSRDPHLRLLSRFGTMSVISCKGVTLMRGKVLVGVVERDFHRFLFLKIRMKQKELSIFVDESGNFQYPDKDSRFYIIALVLHDQSKRIDENVRELERLEAEIGLEEHCFHAGPLIRREKAYAVMSRKWRGRIFSRMLAFSHRVDFRYHCLSVDKSFVSSVAQITAELQRGLVDFLRSQRAELAGLSDIKVYYDCGQAPVTNLLLETFKKESPCPVVFVQDVKPAKYRLFQIADLICTTHLLELKIKHHLSMTASEFKFFGGIRAFEHNVLRRIKAKEV